ncbi:hypothetical protein HZF24_02260 [Sedimentibacter hydroxybenzoicus DSM 7310]|uniref:Uncharacterized protein n=1 Tax=Sedimentibacter hydroxybenzoicus DSM 7310 TaxID=1123245 RepID=A0A974BGZ1_SEDHY|nr:hypothetical protein [Sedimentibacter hydroxybenzoicus]NYB72960.1 hypothetical protein [Sedimentibacter hydroxybenzoicus DSM 7310]
MIDKSETEESIICNLKDAGCLDNIIKQFMDFYKENNTPELKRILSGQRHLLLDEVHDSQRRLYCLDYLIYTLKNKR